MSDRLLKESDVLRIAFQLPLVVNSAFVDAVKALPSARPAPIDVTNVYNAGYDNGYKQGKEDEHRWWSKLCADCDGAVDEPQTSKILEAYAKGYKDGADAVKGIKDENSSEKPNNCEHITEDGVTCAKYPACDDCLDNPLNKVKGSERLLKGKTEPTSSKMEQVDKDINVRSKDEPQTVLEAVLERQTDEDRRKMEESIRKAIEDELQVDGAIDEARFYAHCMNCQRDVADIKCLDCDGDKYFIKDEPQTDCQDCKYAWWNGDAKRYECTVERCQYEDEPQTEREGE